MDKNEFPICDIQYKESLADECSLTDNGNNMDRYVKFSELLNISSKQQWNDLISRIGCYKSITIIDDLKLKNEELNYYKEFYLKSYCQ